MANLRRNFRELRGKFDGSDPFMSGGHQILKIRQPKREIPVWAKNDAQIQGLLLRSFPKLKTDNKQRFAAARWARAIYLYFRVQKTYSQAAAEMNIKPRTFESIIRAIYRASKGLRADGRGRLGVKPRGRPKKYMP